MQHIKKGDQEGEKTLELQNSRRMKMTNEHKTLEQLLVEMINRSESCDPLCKQSFGILYLNTEAAGYIVETVAHAVKLRESNPAVIAALSDKYQRAAEFYARERTELKEKLNRLLNDSRQGGRDKISWETAVEDTERHFSVAAFDAHIYDSATKVLSGQLSIAQWVIDLDEAYDRYQYGDVFPPNKSRCDLFYTKFKKFTNGVSQA